MYGWTNLHRHSEFSLFDGFGRQKDATRYAKELGLNALGISEHGSVSGLVAHYEACKDAGIKAILGCEIYFQPKFDKEKRYYHMCLFCKNKVGYQNLMRIMTTANIENFYRKPVVTLNSLKKHSEGLICSTACLAGIASSAILENDNKRALKRIRLLEQIFGDDLYIEIMPYKVADDNGNDMQLKVDNVLLKICDKYNYKPIITTDSHFIKPEDYEAYQLMYKTYEKIFTRLGIDYKVVLADTGAIGGDGSHQFMALSDVGESDIIYCEHCKYAADEEKAQAKLDGYHHTIEEKGMELVLTPNKKTIDEVSEFLKLSKKDIAKSMVYRNLSTNELVLVMVRGDREVNLIKVVNALKIAEHELVLATNEDILNINSFEGFVGPVGLSIKILVDEEVACIIFGIRLYDRKCTSFGRFSSDDGSRKADPVG